MKKFFPPKKCVPSALPNEILQGKHISSIGKKTSTLQYLLLALALVCTSLAVNAQTTIRYQSDIRGGVTMIGNSWFYSNTTTVAGMTTLIPDVDGNAAGTPGVATFLSTSSDLILPAGSTIVKAYLSIEKGSVNQPFTSVKFLAPGATAYTTLTNTGPYALTARMVQSPLTATLGQWNQQVFEITSLMPATGFVSTSGGGAAGRYFLADPAPLPATNFGGGDPDRNQAMGGWSIIVVYSNPNSKFRNVTVADGWQAFYKSTVNTDITGVKVPSSGIVTAVVGVTGTWGDRGNVTTDSLLLGQTTGALTNLSDPVTGSNTDVLNSSIGMGSQNNVSADGGPVMSGNVSTRNPISVGHSTCGLPTCASESFLYDADVINASGILPPSATPITVRLQQRAYTGDILISGSYFISVDLAPSAVLNKFLMPTTIADGGTATYTWTITNTSSSSIALSGLGFTDNLPASIKIATPSAASIVGGTGGTVTATAGGNVVTVSGLSLAAGEYATITVNVTNVAGQLNPTCGSAPPAAFTNSSANITGTGLITTTSIIPQCLIVTGGCAATAGTLQ